ncbi:hypothetical protein AVW11_28500 [Streptomyces amritsarensis]|uniref:Alpha/beta hydrolase n=1 Tax=Streptomyces amritsarensis TaxID=681158 RepID=A0ABX3FXP2_9ACTN|nr:hypothetical protein [Streptomyces amritsarensis]OLZ58247.1 hypothetical protein AVW11_28500 [Streptomyces amritsarensis]
MSATLVFIHGRRQETKTPEELEREWRAGLAAGLIRAKQKSADSVPVVLPYYAKLLASITNQLAQSSAKGDFEALPDGIDEPAPFHPHLGEDIGKAERELLRSLVVEQRRRRGDLEGLGGLLSGILSWDDARRLLVWLCSHTKADQDYIKAFLSDVAMYLTKARTPVQDLVRKEIPDGDLILVTHSLGTVVARDLLDDKDVRDRTLLWVTAGSPLGLEAVQKNLLSPGKIHPGVPQWVSTYDVNDIVALGHPLKPNWGKPPKGSKEIEDIEVDNGDEPHSIARYLGHHEVARRIGEALA